ncbi:right-handed parallel beta-helix repeat-containing protein [Methylobacterium marchantiae]|uniref:Right-handed parallel beta-helix repeat-containing protein n=1 Tax=Methylobacterium marchantiae TaxID=600331 RepID=A0ABW3X1I4_9HYPH|nr:hypothetical protein AIGOOFII_3164 [Methylobacterium marchantiae]
MASSKFGITTTVRPADAISVAPGDDLQALVDSSPAGSTFWIEAGTHRMQSIIPKDGDHFIGEKGAVLSGATQITQFTREGGHWVASGQSQEGERRATDQGLPGAERAGYPETFFIDDKPLTPVDALSKLAPGKFYFDYAQDKIYFDNDPSGHKVEAGVSPFAFSGSAKNVTIENLVVEKYNSPTQYGAIGGHSEAEGWTVQHNEVRLNYGAGVFVGDNSQIKNNYVHDNGELGLGGSGDNIRVADNEIAHNGYFSGINPNWEGGGTKFSVTDNLVVERNYSHDNKGYGLWTDIDNINTVYDGNTVANNSGGGISHEISYDAIIRNNLITNNGNDSDGWLWGAGIQIQNSSGVKVYNNHVESSNGGNAISLIQQDRGSGAYGEHSTTDNSVTDNVIVTGTPKEGASGAVADFNPSGLLNGNNTFDNNEYHVTNTSDAHWAWNNTLDWDAYRQASGQDAHSTVSTTIPDSLALPVGAAPVVPESPVTPESPVVPDPVSQPAPTEPATPEPVVPGPVTAKPPAPEPSTPVVETPIAPTAPVVPETPTPVTPVPVATAPDPSTGPDPMGGGHSGSWAGHHWNPDEVGHHLKNLFESYADLADKGFGNEKHPTIDAAALHDLGKVPCGHWAEMSGLLS